MVAPKSPGHLVRRMYEEERCSCPTGSSPGLYRQSKRPWTGLCQGIGCTRAGVIETTFREETESDLFGEQAVLWRRIRIDKGGFDTLVEAGYRPEIAYFECLHELKLIVDLIYEGGLDFMRFSVSDTATYGDLTRGPDH